MWYSRVKFIEGVRNIVKKEVELKFFVDGFTEIRKRLKKIGARLSWSGIEKSRYFDTPGRIIKKRGAALRLRTTNHSFLTYKEKVSKGKFKIADEYELEVGNPRELAAIFKRLGFGEVFFYTKRREYWKLPNAEITLDSIPGKKVVEIEASPSVIRALAHTLGLNMARTSTQSYVKLLGKT